MRKKQTQKGIAVLFLLILIFAEAQTIANVILPSDQQAKRQDDFMEGNSTPLKTLQSGSLPKIYPRVEKQINRSPTEIQLIFKITNTLKTPIHNFTLTYWRIKDLAEEHYLDSNVSTNTLTEFKIQISEDESRIVFNFTMLESSSLYINESVILSAKFYANRSKSDLIGDGVYWRCAESFSAAVFYTIDDPAQFLLDPLQESATPDFDDDGIPNIEELELGLDPFTPDLWLRWISLSNETLLQSEVLPYPDYLYGGQVHIGVPKHYENLSLTFKIVNLGVYTQIINFSLNSQIIYERASVVNYDYLLEPSLAIGRQSIEFIVKNSNWSYDLQFAIVFKVGDFIPLDISGDSMDYDGDTLLDSYENELGSEIDDPDSDDDGVPDGYDLDPLAYDMYIAHTTKTYKLPVFYTDSYVRFSIQASPISRDYTIDKFPFGAKFLKISPALRVFGTNPLEEEPIGDYLPDIPGIIEDKVGYLPLSPLRDQRTGALLTYMVTFDYKELNLAKIDHFINLTFEIVWLATEIDGAGNQNLLHIFDVQQDFIIQGFYISETFGIDINVAILGDGLNTDAAYRIQPTVSAIAIWESFMGESNPLYSLQDIPNLCFLSKNIKDMAFLNSTIEELESDLALELGFNSPKNRTFIITQLANTTKYTLTTWRLVEYTIYHDPLQEALDSLEWKIVNNIIAVTGIGVDIWRIWTAFHIIQVLFFRSSATYGYLYNLYQLYGKFKYVFTEMEAGRYSSNYLLGVNYGREAEWGKTLGQISKVFAAIEIAIGAMLLGYGFYLAFWEGYAYTGWKDVVVGGLYIAAGIAALFPGWGTLIGVILGFVALLIDLFFWDSIAALFHLEDPNPRFDITKDKFGITEFEKSIRYSSVTPGSETNMRMSTEINVSGNVDFKFRAQLRIGGGAWGPLVETAEIPPGTVQNITASDEIEEYGTITSADYYFAAYNYYTNEWVSDTINIPLNLTVYPTDIATFRQMVWDGSWFHGQEGVSLNIKASNRIVETGENLDFTVRVYNHADTPQRFNINLLKSYGEVTSLWTLKYSRYDWYTGAYYAPYKFQIASAFPFITPVIGTEWSNYYYEFSFTLKMPSECGPGTFGEKQLILYAQSTTESDIIQFYQISFTVTSTRTYAVGISPNTDLKMPGDNASWILELHNIGTVPDSYSLSLDTFGNIDPMGVSLTPDKVSLGPCHTYYIPIELSIPRTWELPPGNYLNLTIASEKYPESTYHHFPLLQILPFYEVQLNNIQPNVTMRPGTPSYVSMVLQNFGNTPEIIKCTTALEGFDPSPFSSPTSVQLQPGEAKECVFQLNTEREPLLAPDNYSLALLLTNEEGFLLINASIKVKVLDFHAVQLIGALDETGTIEHPRAIYEDRPYSFSVEMKNIGNTPDYFNLELVPQQSQSLINISTNQAMLAPNEENIIEITVIPQVRGVETFYLIAHFTDENGNLQKKNISSTLNVIDEDTSPPIIYFINAVPPVVMDAEIASNVYYRSFLWTVYDRSGIYKMDASYEGDPIEYQSNLEPILMIYNRTPDATETFNMASPEAPALLSIRHSLGESLGKYYTPEGPPSSFLNYFTIDLAAPGGQIYGITIRRNGEEITPLVWDLIQRAHSIFDIAIPSEVGVFQFDITVKTYYWLNIYHSYAKTFHIQLFANVAFADASYYVEIPIQLDDPTTAENESLHYFTVNAVDADYDLGLSEDRSGQIINRTICILDDDTIPPEIQITASAFNPDVLLQGVLDLNMTESWRTITDQLAQFGFSRWVSWNLEDASGFSQTQVTYEIESFDGIIILPERIIFNETKTGSPYLQNLVGAFICSLIPGYHYFRISCSDGDADWDGDTLSNYKEYVFTITDDDESPLELHNLTINSQMVIDAVPLIEMTAHIIDPTFARTPDLFQFLVFVDDQWVPDVSVSFEWSYDNSTSPPTFQEAFVKLRFENTWAERDLSGNHTVEILTVDDDFDVLSMDPNPFAQYFEQNYETYRILQMAENLSFYSLFQGFYSEPLPYSFAGYFFNQSIYHLDFLPWFHPLIILTPYLINLFGFPVLDYTILDTNGEIYGRGQGFSPIYSAILPSFYAAAQLFFILLHNGVLESYDIPWARFNTSSVTLSRGTMEIPSQYYGPTELVDPLSFTVPAGSFQVLESFDGLLLNYSYAQVAGPYSQAGTYNVSYTHIEGSNFSVYAMSDAFQSDLMFEDAQSRIITRSNLFSPNTHTPIWIFANASLGDIVPIIVNGEGDHLFNISRVQQYSISNTERVNAWALEDLTMPGGLAYYEVATGILLEGTFYFGEGYHYTLKLLDSNLEYTPPPILSIYPPTLSGTLSPESGSQLQKYRFSAVYTDLDNNTPAYVAVLINGTPYLMQKQDPSDDTYSDGCIYQLFSYLPPGFHNYSFQCSDLIFVTTSPRYFGPDVVAQPPPPRETLIFTIYPELLIGTPTLLHTLENGTTVFLPTERLTLTYDLATGIVLCILLEHLANPTDPTDQNVTNLELMLEETNLLLPYEFLYHNQIIPRFIPADAALQSFFTSFEVLPRYEMTGSVVPLTSTVFDNERAQWVLNITNVGNIADSYQLSIQNLTLGSATFSQNPIDLLPQASALVTLQVHPLQLGTESFAVFIKSLSAPAVNLTLLLQLTVLDDDALPPTIALQYVGDYTDANPGFIRVVAQDPSGLALDPTGEYAVPFSFEPQTFEFVALDNDSDRPGDQLGQTATMTLTLHDDDTTAPLVTNLSATFLDTVLLVQFMASDASGIGAVAVTINGTLMLPLAQSVNGSSFTLTFVNLWTDEGGTYLMELQVTDADGDRPADALTTVFQTTFISAPDLIRNLMLKGINQIGTLEVVITTINCTLVRWLLSCVVNRADYNLETALSLYLAGNTTQAGLRVWIANCQMCVSEFIVKIANWLNVLEEDLAVTLLEQMSAIQQTLTQILARL